jgi:hypothetical protein
MRRRKANSTNADWVYSMPVLSVIWEMIEFPYESPGFLKDPF